MSFQTDRNPSARWEPRPAHFVDPHDPSTWELPGGTYFHAGPGVQGHGGGGHGGGHGGHGGGGGWGGYGGFAYADPWIVEPYWPTEEEEYRRRHHLAGEGELSTGTGALVVMLGIWLAYEYAGKRAR